MRWCTQPEWNLKGTAVCSRHRAVAVGLAALCACGRSEIFFTPLIGSVGTTNAGAQLDGGSTETCPGVAQISLQVGALPPSQLSELQWGTQLRELFSLRPRLLLRRVYTGLLRWSGAALGNYGHYESSLLGSPTLTRSELLGTLAAQRGRLRPAGADDPKAAAARFALARVRQ